MRTSIKLSTRDSYSAWLDGRNFVPARDRRRRRIYMLSYMCRILRRVIRKGITIDPYPWKLQTIMEWELGRLTLIPLLRPSSPLYTVGRSVERCVSSFNNKTGHQYKATGWVQVIWNIRLTQGLGIGVESKLRNEGEEDREGSSESLSIDMGRDKMTLLHYIWGNLITIWNQFEDNLI